MYCKGVVVAEWCLSPQVCRWVLKYRTSKNPLIQMTILNLLPRLAAFQPNTFTGKVYLIVMFKASIIKTNFTT